MALIPYLNLWQKLREYAELSEYEAKVYVSLVINGPSTASDVSLTSGVPRTKIYTTMNKLIERGLVNEIPGEPRVFVPIPPVSAFNSQVQSLEERARDFYLTIRSLQTAYERTTLTAKTRKDEIWIIHGRSEVLKMACEMLLRAERDVQIMTTEEGLILFYKTSDKLLDRLSENSIKVKIMTPFGFRNRHIVQELRYICEVQEIDRHEPLPSTLLINVDQNEILIAILKIEGEYNPFSYEDVGIFTQNPILCALLSQALLKTKRRKIHI